MCPLRRRASATSSSRPRSTRIERHASADAFLAAAESWLLEAEAENNLLLGLALARRGQPAADPAPYWATAADSEAIVGCACRTPPHPLVVSRIPGRAIASLVESVALAYTSLNGVNGPTESAEAFADAWIARHGGSWRTRFRMRLHELTKVTLAGARARGALHKVTPAELRLAEAWMDEFVRDVGVTPSASDVAGRIANGQLYFWVDGEGPRAMVSWSRATAHGCAINTVYTPPHFRGMGYATAAVAALSEMLLGAGRRFCCLYTDLANPTANSIYAQVGYRPIRDDAEIAFET
jgi:predicted GNAT family acetyltransferase